MSGLQTCLNADGDIDVIPLCRYRLSCPVGSDALSQAAAALARKNRSRAGSGIKTDSLEAAAEELFEGLRFEDFLLERMD